MLGVRVIHWGKIVTAIIKTLLGATATIAIIVLAPTAQAQKAKSTCNAITEEAACKANATCAWVAALKDAKTGKQKRKAYCKTKPKPPAKKSKDTKK